MTNDDTEILSAITYTARRQAWRSVRAIARQEQDGARTDEERAAWGKVIEAARRRAEG